MVAAELNDAGAALIASREVVGFTIEAGFTHADYGFSVLPTDVPILNDPTWNSVSDQLAILSSSDVTQEELRFELVSGPDWLSLSSTGLLSGTPTNDEVGERDVTVRVIESGGESDTKTFTLTVNNVNDAPVLESISDSSVDQDAAFSYQLTATDVDLSVDVNETLTFEAVTKPDGMTVSASGLITGTPDNEDVGSHSVTVKVTTALERQTLKH